jgi:hypothetical protein
MDVDIDNIPHYASGMKAIWAWVATVSIGCAGPSIDTNQELRNAALNRAVFDLACAREKLSSLDLEGGTGDTKVSTLGIQGCGKKAVYVRVPDSDRMVLNGQVTDMR